MKKEYIRPDAEMVKFVETEEIMTANPLFGEVITSTEIPNGLGWDY